MGTMAGAPFSGWRSCAQRHRDRAWARPASPIRTYQLSFASCPVGRARARNPAPMARPRRGEAAAGGKTNEAFPAPDPRAAATPPSSARAPQEQGTNPDAEGEAQEEGQKAAQEEVAKQWAEGEAQAKGQEAASPSSAGGSGEQGALSGVDFGGRSSSVSVRDCGNNAGGSSTTPARSTDYEGYGRFLRGRPRPAGCSS